MPSHNETNEGQQWFSRENGHDTNHPNKRRNMEVVLTVPLIVASILLLVLLSVAVHNLESYTPMPCHVPGNVSFKIASTLISYDHIPRTDYVCSFNTSEHFLKTLTDDLSEYCKPRTKTKGIFDAKMHKCKYTELYIPRECVCDTEQQCPQENDISRKEECKTCSKVHCPCQNGGICRKCPNGSSSGDNVECLCTQGTSGKYCTKITQRICRQNKTVADITHCNNTNALVCFIQEPSTKEHYLCQLSVLEDNGQYPPCFTQSDENNHTVNKEPFTGKDNDMRKEGSNLKTSKILLKISLAVIGIIIIYIVILQLCRKRAKSTSQI